MIFWEPTWGIPDYKPQSVIQVEGPLLLLDQLVLGRDVVPERVLTSVPAQVLHSSIGFNDSISVAAQILYVYMYSSIGFKVYVAESCRR